MKNIGMKICLLFVFILLSNSIYAQAANNRGIVSTNSIELITGEEYVMGVDGIPRITLNVWGHVKYPGTYLMYDGIDLLTALSMAGGPLKGAKTTEIKIISKDGESQIINLDEVLEQKTVSSIILKPHDTIYMDETFGSYILSRGNVVNVIIQITNLILIASGNR